MSLAPRDISFKIFPTHIPPVCIIKIQDVELFTLVKWLFIGKIVRLWYQTIKDRNMNPRDVKSAADAITIIEERCLEYVKVGLFDIDGIMRGKYM